MNVPVANIAVTSSSTNANIINLVRQMGNCCCYRCRWCWEGKAERNNLRQLLEYVLIFSFLWSYLDDIWKWSEFTWKNKKNLKKDFFLEKYTKYFLGTAK